MVALWPRNASPPSNLTFIKPYWVMHSLAPPAAMKKLFWKEYPFSRLVSPPLIAYRVRYKFSPKHPNFETFNPFCTLLDDDQPVFSIDDKRFLSIMEESVSITSSGSIQLPLPVKKTSLPQNKAPVFMRTAKTSAGIKAHKPKLDACLEVHL